MGWDNLDWVSTVGDDFHRDLGFLHTEGAAAVPGGRDPAAVEQDARMCDTDVTGYVSERPGLSVYITSDGAVCRTKMTTARGLEPAMGYYGLLDSTPLGREESASERLWVRRHDEYCQARKDSAADPRSRVPDGQHHDFRFDQVGDLEQKCGCGAHVPCRSWKGK